MDPLTNAQALRVAAAQAHVTIFEVLERMGIDVPHETHQMKCPFHADRSPSARVYADQNKIYCFTCQKSWDVIAAAQDHLGVPFGDALVWLEQEFSVPGGASGVVGSIRSQLLSRQPPDIRESVTMVEQRLKAQKAKLGFDRYTRLLYALDLTVLDAGEKRIKTDEVSTRLLAILRAAV